MRSRFGLVRSAISAVALLVLMGSAAEAQKPKTFSVNEIVKYFDTIVFGSELDPKLAARMISKW